MKTRIVTHAHEHTPLEAFCVEPAEGWGPKAAVLVIHEWWGINDHIRAMTERIAALGYVAMAADIFGKDVRPATKADASKLAAAYRQDTPLLRARAKAGLEALAKQPGVDTTRLAAVGFCFGGSTALELARSGAPVKGVVSIHGALSTPDAADAKNIKGRVLALHGAADPWVTWAQVDGFQKEMHAAGVDWELLAYGGAVHGFTNPANGNDPSTGSAYDARATNRAMRAMTAFLAEVLK